MLIGFSGETGNYCHETTKCSYEKKQDLDYLADDHNGKELLIAASVWDTRKKQKIPMTEQHRTFLKGEQSPPALVALSARAGRCCRSPGPPYFSSWRRRWRSSCVAMGSEMSEAMLGVGSFTDRWLGEHEKVEACRLEELRLRSVGHCGLALAGWLLSAGSVFLSLSVTGEAGAGLFGSDVGETGTWGLKDDFLASLETDGLFTWAECWWSGDLAGFSRERTWIQENTHNVTILQYKKETGTNYKNSGWWKAVKWKH